MKTIFKISYVTVLLLMFSVFAYSQRYDEIHKTSTGKAYSSLLKDVETLQVRAYTDHVTYGGWVVLQISVDGTEWETMNNNNDLATFVPTDTLEIYPPYVDWIVHLNDCKFNYYRVMLTNTVVGSQADVYVSWTRDWIR